RAALAPERTATTTVLRLGTICGLSGRMRFDLLVNDMARSAASSRRIEVYKPQAWRPYLHIADVARAVEATLSAPHPIVAARVFNVVAQNYQKSDLVDLTRKHFPNAEIAMVEAEADNRDYRVSAERVRRELGFECLHTVEDAFVQVAQAVGCGAFIDPWWPGYSAVPLKAALNG
ncbi:MAG: NAD-dependent epimerase/dehydratase family protein, partial [Vulcanimicrobiaceae bacterium]